MDMQQLAQKFGKVAHEGKEYTLAQVADYSNRVFPGWWGDVQEGEEYTAEFSASAYDNDGNSYMIYWQFDSVKGQEPEDLSNYPWDDEHISLVVPQ